MSRRFAPGDIVWKQANAGFMGVGAYGIIRADTDPNDAEPFCVRDWCRRGNDTPDPDCQLDDCCHDYGCLEWPDVWVVAEDSLIPALVAIAKGKFAGNACHVNECEMQYIGRLLPTLPLFDYRNARGVLPWQPGDELPEDQIRRIREEHGDELLRLAGG